MDEHNFRIPIMFRTTVVSMCWLLLMSLPQSYCDFDYTVCKKEPYECGELKDIFYPFWGNNRAAECGGGDPFKLTCNDFHGYIYTTIQIGSQNFTVENIFMETKSMRLGRPELALNVCSLHSEDINVNSTAILYTSPSVHNITIFFNCSPIPFSVSKYDVECGSNDLPYYVVDYEHEQLINDLSRLCKGRLHLPTDAPVDYYYGVGMDALEEVIRHGFEINYNVSAVSVNCGRCPASDGECWREKDVESCYICQDGSHYCSNKKCRRCKENEEECQRDDGDGKDVKSCYICQDGSHYCSKNMKFNLKVKIIIGVTGASIAGVLICIAILCPRYKSSTWQGHFGLTTKSNQNIEAFLKNHGSLTLKRYKLSDVKKMSNNFKVKLGQGGFGAVYKGSLSNGSSVAVKLLNSSKGNGEDFINEVASISRTSHVNIVTLLGFCLEGRKKALIYEFMPNGSLDKFVYNKGLKTTRSLSWDNLRQISIGIARGLEYLHRGCNTRILHFDIKPHNILLDDKFCPKISDFGLAKLCPRNESIISMSDQRGTIGYVAPEVWNRHFGGISYKSDVYSYGMMLLEMVGGRRNINAEASNTSEIYFPDWIYKRLEQGGDLRADGAIAAEENDIARRMTVVGLWCVQTFPKDRPTMSRVIDMLEGNINSLEMPPKPVLSSPTRSAPEFSSSSLQSE